MRKVPVLLKDVNYSVAGDIIVVQSLFFSEPIVYLNVQVLES
jgi:hypothetical protein